MSLTDAQIRNLKPKSKPRKVADSHDLYLLVNPGGSCLWYLKYRIDGKESHLGLGAYPDMSLNDARQQSDGTRKLLAQDINPALNLVGVTAPPVRPIILPCRWSDCRNCWHAQAFFQFLYAPRQQRRCRNSIPNLQPIRLLRPVR